MCRLLGWATREPTTLSDLLGEDLTAFTQLSTQHADGWGVARSTRRRVLVRKRPDTARTSAAFARWAARRRTDLGMAHLRRATLGLGIGPANTHPFGDGRVAFAHNGSIRPPAALDQLLSPRSLRDLLGTTDSERYFAAVAETLRDGATPEEALRTTADRIAATAPFTSLNCLLLTPDRLYAFCRYDADSPPDDDDPEYYNLRFRVGPEAVVVASSGWGRDWRELGNGELLAVSRRTLECAVTTPEGLRVPA